ncbi:MAG: hypothetical protein AAGJ81_12280 [Verrucomicrobiota bacterium]
MKARRFLAALLLCFVAAVGSAKAQEAGLQTDAEDPLSLNFDFSVFPLESAEWKGVLYAPNGDPTDGVEELVFNPHERTLGYSYSGPAPFRVFRRLVDPEGEEFFRSVGEISLKPTRDDLILFFSLTPDASRMGPYRIQFMVDSNYTFPEDSVVFFNSTGATFYGVLGGERVILEPGASKPTDVSSFFDSPAPIALVIRDGDQIHRVLVNRIRFFPDRRTLMILRPPASPNSMRIRTQRLTEYMGDVAPDSDRGA